MKARTLLLGLLLLATSIAQGKELRLASGQAVEDYYASIASAVTEAFVNAGHSIDKMTLPEERSLAMFHADEIDVQVMRLEGFDEYAPGAVRIDVELITLDVVALVREDSPFNSVEDLKEQVMVGVRGIKIHAAVARQMSATTIELGHFDAAIKFLLAGRADFLPVAEDFAQALMGDHLPLRKIPEPLMQVKMYAWVREEHADIVPTVEQELLKLKAAGRF